jgi:diacylglycerol kinase family enzyme
MTRIWSGPVWSGRVWLARVWLARLAVVAAIAAVAVLLALAGRGSVLLIVTTIVGLGVVGAAVWWFLTHHGVVRWVAAALIIGTPIAVAVLFATRGLVWVAVLAAGLWAVALGAGRAALAGAAPPARAVEYETPPPKHPYFIMNRWSGGGKVLEYRLAEKARALGAEVFVVDEPWMTDFAALACRAIVRGADLIGVAGGDGTIATVAAVAAKHDVPLLVVSAGTRNHFALDLGLDRADPSRCLDALSDGVELRVDLGLVGDRTFVNNASFGAYAELVRSPEYRDHKTGTAIDLLPDILTSPVGAKLSVRGRDWTIDRPQALLVSNNPYDMADIGGLGRRPRLDGGVLGVLVVKVESAVQAAALLSRTQSKGLTTRAADRLVVDGDAPMIPVGIDGEAITLPTPVQCTIKAGALRVRVPRHRPGVPTAKPAVDWRRLWHLAFGAD